MTCGIKKPNTLLRISVGLLILAIGFYFESYFGLLGIIPIIFGIIEFCPICYLKGRVKRKLK